MRSTISGIVFAALLCLAAAPAAAEPASAPACGAACNCPHEKGQACKCGKGCKCGSKDAAQTGEAHRCNHEHGAATTPAAAATPAAPVAGQLEVAVTEKGFEPARIEVKKGKPITVVFTRKTDRTCAKEVVIDTGAGKVDKKLPLNEPVTVKLTFKKSGEFSYACGMNMIKGVFVVK